MAKKGKGSFTINHGAGIKHTYKNGGHDVFVQMQNPNKPSQIVTGHYALENDYDMHGKKIGSNYLLVDVTQGQAKPYKEGGVPMAGGYNLTELQQKQDFPFNPDNYVDVEKFLELHKGQTFNQIIKQYENHLAPIEVIVQEDGSQQFRQIRPCDTAISDPTYSNKEKRMDLWTGNNVRLESTIDAQTLLDVMCSYGTSGNLSESAGAGVKENVAIKKPITKQSTIKSVKRQKAEAIAVGLGVGLAVTIPAAMVVYNNNPGLFNQSLGETVNDIHLARWNTTGAYNGTVTGTSTVDLRDITLDIIANLTAQQPTNTYANLTQGLVNAFFTNASYSGNVTLNTSANSSLEGTLDVGVDSSNPLSFRSSYFNVSMDGVSGLFNYNNTRITGNLTGSYDGTTTGNITNGHVSGLVDWALEDTQIQGAINNLTLNGSGMVTFDNTTISDGHIFLDCTNSSNFTASGNVSGLIHYATGDVPFTGNIADLIAEGILNNATFEGTVTGLNVNGTARMDFADVVGSGNITATLTGRVRGNADWTVSGYVNGTSNGIWRADNVDLAMTGEGQMSLYGTADGEMGLILDSGRLAGNWRATTFDAWMNGINRGALNGGLTIPEINSELRGLYIEGGLVNSSARFAEGADSFELELNLEQDGNMNMQKIAHFPVGPAALILGAAGGLGHYSLRKNKDEIYRKDLRLSKTLKEILSNQEELKGLKKEIVDDIINQINNGASVDVLQEEGYTEVEPPTGGTIPNTDAPI